MLKNGYTEDEVYTTLNKESGLLGLAGKSSDMRIIKDNAQQGDSDCRLARQVFSERCRKYLGSYFVKLGGKVDAIVFTGGIGEGDADMRQSILEGLQENMQIGLDPTKNENAVGPDMTMTISPAFAKTKVLVVPTDEEISIATQSANLVLPEPKVETVDSLPRLMNARTRGSCVAMCAEIFSNSLIKDFVKPHQLIWTTLYYLYKNICLNELKICKVSQNPKSKRC